MFISAEEAKRIMDSGADAVILDVRDEDEYNQGHVPGAVLLPYRNINEDTADEMLPDKDRKILVYCRSGHRASIAMAALESMDYTDVECFGGIEQWPYDIVK